MGNKDAEIEIPFIKNPELQMIYSFKSGVSQNSLAYLRCPEMVRQHQEWTGIDLNNITQSKV